MRAHVLLKLLHELDNKKLNASLLRILSLIHNELNKINCTGARMQYSIHNMTF